VEHVQTFENIFKDKKVALLGRASPVSLFSPSSKSLGTSLFLTVIAVTPLRIFVKEFFRQRHFSIAKAIYCRVGMLTKMEVM